MRLGLVKHLNAHPLDYGFRKMEAHTLVEDTPARLYAMLSSAELDAALISSVECLRNEHRFGYCKSVGVCCDGALRSILYFEARKDRAHIDLANHAPSRIYADSGSRSSVALLQVLYHSATGQLPHLESAEPEKIPEAVLRGEHAGGLLIGDAALRFSQSPQADRFLIRDLGQWWKEQESLPFVFALWAYPGEKPVESALFEESLQEGLQHLPQIASESEFSFAEEYITDLLHYRLGKQELLALQRFRERLLALDLL